MKGIQHIMTHPTVKARFAPSPTGYIHIGNVRTALFNDLLARHHRGVFLLRIEDTDPARSKQEYTAALQQDLHWLGLHWQEGPEVGGDYGPYHQSERADIYQQYYEKLREVGSVYPCFCTDQELQISRKVQLAAGKPPRYSGKCAGLSTQEVETRLNEGLEPVLRFRVPRGQVVEFDDMVRGPQRFSTDDIGDFVISRGDGSAAFFFSNAIDDSLMNVTHVLRGEDHLTNTPRQILILQALGLRVASYGHIAMIVGDDGSPLSKRHGSRSVREMRAEGYLPEAVVNYLARLGHSYENDVYMSIGELATHFDAQRLGRAPARYDHAQLLRWQQEAVQQADTGQLRDWLNSALVESVPADRLDAFIAVVRGNIVFPKDAVYWAQVAYGGELALNDECQAVITAAGREFFIHALSALDAQGTDFKSFAEALKLHSGAKGKGLFMPLRAALTGSLGGPEMGAMLPLIGLERARARLQRHTE